MRYSRRLRSNAAIRKLNFAASLDYIANSVGGLETRTQTGIFTIDLTDGGKLDFQFTRNYELLEEPFEVAEGVALPIGGYDYDEFRARLTLGPLGKITETTVTRGGFFSGNRTEVSLGARLDVTTQLAFEPLVSANWVDLPEGQFTTKLVSARATFSLSPRSFLGALVQYNSSIDSLTANVRFRWEYQPGSDVFVVYSEGRTTRGLGDPALESRGFVVKFTRLLRF